MAQTDKLLSLVDQFPQAFADAQETSASFQEGEAQQEVAIKAEQSENSLHHTSSQQNSNSEPLQAHFLALMQEFPHAFIDPSEPIPTSSPSETTGTSDSQATEKSSPEESAASTEKKTTVTPGSTLSTATAEFSRPSAPPAGYDQALQRNISTFTWGEVQVFFTYSQEGLQSIWVTVGKSGTEVQSLCEALSRLINLLLEQQVSIPEICRQIRGIRGADSEGLGPNRILGLADLVGKALQEAPERLFPVSTLDTSRIGSRTSDVPQDEHLDDSTSSIGEKSHSTQHETEHTNLSQETPLSSTQATTDWSIPEEGNLTAMLCPECSAELHHMNGCSGGACPVCGYSSCS